MTDTKYNSAPKRTGMLNFGRFLNILGLLVILGINLAVYFLRSKLESVPVASTILSWENTHFFGISFQLLLIIPAAVAGVLALLQIMGWKSYGLTMLTTVLALIASVVSLITIIAFIGCALSIIGSIIIIFTAKNLA